MLASAVVAEAVEIYQAREMEAMLEGAYREGAAEADSQSRVGVD